MIKGMWNVDNMSKYQLSLESHTSQTTHITDNQLLGSGGVQLLDGACEKGRRECEEKQWSLDVSECSFYISLHSSSMFCFMKDLVGTEKVCGRSSGVWASIDEK